MDSSSSGSVTSAKNQIYYENRPAQLLVTKQTINARILVYIVKKINFHKKPIEFIELFLKKDSEIDFFQICMMV